MNFTHLFAFFEVARAGSISAGAERLHVRQPAIPLLDADGERGMPHPERRVTALLVIGRRPSPVLGQEERQLVARGSQILRLRIQREQRGISLHTVVEAVDQRLEERHAADRVVERDLTVHVPSLRTPERILRP